jgi:GT2 family glycosyltransferase
LLEVAADPEVEYIVIADADAVLAPDAFGGLRRALTEQTAIVGGRALVFAMQRFGDMLGPSRSGPNPFELANIIAPQDDRGIADYIRGPIDVPHRGAYVVSAAFVRALGAPALDPVLLHLDLAVHARAAGAGVVCEPAQTYQADEDPLALRLALGDLRRYATSATWNVDTMHREPPRLRSVFVSREMRVMGNIRGYARQPYPPIDVLVLAGDEVARARAQRAATPLAVNGQAIVCDPREGDALRTALARTSERYLLVADANAMPDRARVEVLAERLERSGRIAVALERDTPPFGAALFHCGRIVNGAGFSGASVADAVASAVTTLPRRRLFAATPNGRIVPDPLPELRPLASYDLAFIAASKPVVVEQSVRAVLGEIARGTITAVYPAGSLTIERMLGGYAGVQLAPDSSDVQLAVGLNRVLGLSTAPAIAIVRDDAQLPHGVLDRLADAFRRIPGLGIAVPRVGGSERPESLPDLGYRSSAEMQLLYDRRAEAFAREATLLEVATAPVMMVSREALDVLGGFDEQFGFSRLGVEDYSRRARSANFLVACCEDAYAHLFAPEEAQSFVGNLDAAPFLRATYEKRWAVPRGFTPADRVPLRTDSAPPVAPAVASTLVRLLVPIADQSEWERALPLFAELAATFRASDALEVAVGLDGTFGLQAALSALREVLIASTVPMEETINVSIDFVGDIAAWRDASTCNVRVRGFDRPALDDVPAIDDAAAVRALLTV